MRHSFILFLPLSVLSPLPPPNSVLFSSQVGSVDGVESKESGTWVLFTFISMCECCCICLQAMAQSQIWNPQLWKRAYAASMRWIFLDVYHYLNNSFFLSSLLTTPNSLTRGSWSSLSCARNHTTNWRSSTVSMAGERDGIGREGGRGYGVEISLFQEHHHCWDILCLTSLPVGSLRATGMTTPLHQGGTLIWCLSTHTDPEYQWQPRQVLLQFQVCQPSRHNFSLQQCLEQYRLRPPGYTLPHHSLVSVWDTMASLDLVWVSFAGRECTWGRWSTTRIIWR